ncbi:CPBP family intramembrane glutamic endopeptidase [Pendulispora albinea]|uniref:CPBP family intramembrane metalloprotease n=1 Tax=Pendulispora albinea TaxID=2741071 RepID=A0ABZ2M9W8_9BACT
MKPLAQVAKTLGSGLALQAGILLVGVYFQKNAVGAAAIQAAITEFGAGRIGVMWSDPHAPAPSSSAIARRALRGAAFAAALAVVLLVVALLARAASLHMAPQLGILALVNGLLVATLVAVRDELLLRGVILHALRGTLTRAAQLVICGLVAAAASWGSQGGAPLETVLAGLLGVGYAALWMKDRGAWMAWGAHATFHYLMATVTHGAVFDVRIAQGSWAQALW